MAQTPVNPDRNRSEGFQPKCQAFNSGSGFTIIKAGKKRFSEPMAVELESIP